MEENQDVKITIVDRDGVSHTIDAPTDMAMNLMEVVRAYELAPEGTIGICGGMAMCASCQCYVKSNHELPEMQDDEEAMLSEAFYVKDNSRLGCQIQITPDMDGLEVELAPES
ncbi:2Fe-2S iron-sulfur cluster-binding family protein [Pontimicrobium aquaticum]|uniref:2Fe-2S iron-sulfur cluster binding domain-containing protein n=1 Tax=Pontimicrobium aquaticum TaxID=2565367 RepID=A0A4U0F0Q8_9FLAO|nr:2Fe-2S iron-sulfur cluster-binding protein [Pontimicrobium aquaticum]TJY37956.1 2Fe-2S iron-sulfur cluster binding domain-containing protein [Pontimicrobium aquaticum]